MQANADAELTTRAVVVGLAIGLVLCATNTYFGLQSGWISMMSIQASLLGYAVFKVLPVDALFCVGLRERRPLTVKENIVIQTTAAATGTLPLAAGFVGIVPALEQLDPSRDGSGPLQLSFGTLVLWSIALAFFGVFLAVPLREQVIVRERLVFPSGTATAQIINMLHAKRRDPAGESGLEEQEGLLRGVEGAEASTDATGPSPPALMPTSVDPTQWAALLGSFGLSSLLTLSNLAFPVTFAMPVFDIFGPLAHTWLWWFSPSLSYVGQGMIMGFPTTLSMAAGMFVAWGILSPLASLNGWAPGPVGDQNTGSRGWILWPALAVMMVESVISLGTVAISVLRPYWDGPHQTSSGAVSRGNSAFSLNEASATDPSQSAELAAEMQLPHDKDAPVSARVVVIGLVASCLGCVVLVSFIFGERGISWWATIIALALACVFSILGVRSLGETDLNPVSAIGKISQLIFAVIQPGNIVANIIAGGISEAGAQQAGDLMQDLKTGYLLGASSHAQFVGQLAGSALSVFASTGMYVLYRKVYSFPSATFPVPTSLVWLNLARLLNNGELPPRSQEAMFIFGMLFTTFAVLKLKGRSKYLPSGIAFSIGFINTPSFTLARLLGGLISYHFSKNHTSHLQNITLIIVASGFVLGEGLTSILGLILKSANVGPLSCVGCHSGGGGYCGGGC